MVARQSPRRQDLRAPPEGAIAWDERARDFDWAVTTALPDLVRGKFQSEPLYVDLTWANHQDQLDLQNARFRQAILDIAEPLHGKDKDQLDGEDVRQFKTTRRLRWAAVAGLVILALASTAAALIAVKQRNVAITQTRVALSRQLAAEAVASDTRLDVAFLLAVTAHRLSETPQARAALQRLLSRTLTIRAVLASERPEQALAFSPDGRLLATAAGPSVAASDDPEVSLVSMQTHQSVAQLKPAHNQRAQAIAFHPDGKSLAVAYRGGTLLLWDVASRQPTTLASATHGATISSARTAGTSPHLVAQPDLIVGHRPPATFSKSGAAASRLGGRGGLQFGSHHGGRGHP